MTLHDQLIASKALLHVSCTGAGPALQSAIWGTPGSSEYFVGYFTPYRRTQLHSFLGKPPDESYVSENVALDMASASYIRAAEAKVMEELEGHPIGVGVTAAVASSKLPRGEHRAHCAIITKDTVVHFMLTLKKGIGPEVRASHDQEIANVVQSVLSLVLEGKLWSEEWEAKALERFYEYPIFHTNGTRRKPEVERGIYLPATLNPIHDGHREMCRAAEALLGPGEGIPGRIKATYLVSSVSPHKGRLRVQDMLFKAGMLRAERWRRESRMVEFTRDEPLFIDKVRKRPGSIFLLGADTMQRMLDPKWGPEIKSMLTEIRDLRTKFYVMSRLVNGELLQGPEILTRLNIEGTGVFYRLPGRVDISSTELRDKSL